ncbi:YihY/virulence factor BrkB family protein [Mycobacterium sp. Aquia_216]|uniref:YihY/virulence factor BrkB family protein n=1 Tax=Mycobacterium sp. Aquia_216 TaxID=2991729 RepID=UPI00227B9818|nr:YihY/virulence factor BrkB family protein [Mycobacterium sp. Aquia_216]WAJ47598.1 YihY/virulence factor BrkB family protein [Mycobacterium sp. Aquia_216]
MATGETEDALTERRKRAPDPDDPSKPESPDDLTRASWFYVLRKTAREVTNDQCTDLAAALTYYGVLSVFPALLVMVSLLGVFGEGRRTTNALLDAAGVVVPASAVDMLRQPIEQIVDSRSAGFALVFSILGALWSASGYIGAFGRAMNRVYGIAEGRPFWKLRPMQLALTVAALILAAAVAFMLAISGSLTQAVGSAIGLGHAAQMTWSIAKWPMILVLVTLVVAILYYVTPNVRQPKFRWLSVGSTIAIMIWTLASVGFGFYVSDFGSYNKTYGALAGIIVFLLWLWITNLALLFGAELDAELERGRQLQAGIGAERELQLPPKDTRVVEKNEAAEKKDIRRGRYLRRTRGRHE